jgi:uncharacterized protein (TIGR03663 family)
MKLENLKLHFTEFNNKELLFLAIIILLGIVFRFLDLDIRPIHHDESLHGVYGLYYYTDNATGFYKYNPLLHGPFLYNTLPWFYHFFGVSLTSIRLMAAFSGLLISLFPLLFSRYLGSQKTLLFLCFTLLSPTLIFWSRFAREDPHIILFTMSFLFIYFTNQNQKLRNLVLPTLFVLPFCVKENAYLFLVLLIAYLVAETFTFKFLLKRPGPSIKTLFNGISKSYVHFFIGCAIAAFVYCYYYSAGFVYPEGILDGLYRKSLAYWFEQHKVERIAGPFSYQFFMISWYEPVFLFAVIAHLIHFYRKAPRWALLSFIVPVTIAFIASFLVSDTAFTTNWFLKFFKLKIPVDITLCALIVVQSLIAFYLHLKNDQRFLAFLSYLFWSQAFTYCYVGEKVPWLASYPFLAGILYLAFYFEFKKKIWGVIFAVFIINILFSLRTNFSDLDEKKELIMQVHTTKEFDMWAKKIAAEQEMGGDKFLVLSAGETTWPLFWYFFKRQNFIYHSSYGSVDKFQYIFGEVLNDPRFSDIERTHEKRVISFRGWWVPDYKTMTLSNYFGYMFKRKTWNNGAEMKVPLYIKY